MTDNPDRIHDLLTRYNSSSCTQDEMQELFVYVRDANYKEQILQYMDDRLKGDLKNSLADDVDWEFMFKEITALANGKVVEITPKRFKPGMKAWIGYAAAVMVLVAAGVYFFNRKAGLKDSEAMAATYATGAPGGNKAVLVLADGRNITLDSASGGVLANQGGARIEKMADGSLIYKTGRDLVSSNLVMYNSIYTPRGGQYKITLQDGTQAWLNAGSSIRFPSVFTGPERKVIITGEVYFEVAGNAKMPFKVNVNDDDTQVDVLGTRFNINAYKDEVALRTTLIDGSVRVKNKNTGLLLKPGKQAVIHENASITEQDADVDREIAWKNGFFQFEGAGLEEIMRPISRWYDVEIVYEGAPLKRTFTGEIQRDLQLMQVLKNLEQQDLHFRLEKGKLIVTQNPGN